MTQSVTSEPELQVTEAADFLKRQWNDPEPEVAIVLGSGLGGLAEAVDDPQRIGYARIPGFPEPKVAGHGGELILGTLEGKRVVLQSGRFHLYEGHHTAVVGLPVRVFARLGVQTLVVTNAAGGINRRFRPPMLMLISDHMNLMGRNPLRGAVVAGEDRFPDMSEPYSERLRTIAREVARKSGIPLEEGVYCGLLGPTYETPAEVRMLERLGADAVGMSTVPEVIVARARRMEVLGISTISNVAAGMSADELSHEEVLEAGKQVGRILEDLVRGVLRRL